MTRTKSKHATQKVSVHRNKIFRKQTLSIGTTRNRSSVQKVKPISNLRKKLTIPQTKTIASSKSSYNVISQQKSLDVPSEEDEEVKQTELSLYQMCRNYNSSSSTSHEDQDMFDAKDEHSQVLEYSDNESSNEKDDFSVDKQILEEDIGEYQEQNFVFANPEKKQ